ncbi:MAG: protein translocase subunit SecF [Chloroflexota bacterium]
MIDIIGKRYFFFILSLVIIVPGLVALGWMGATGRLPLSIDFTGGSLLEVSFASAQPQPADIISLYAELGVKDTSVQTTSVGSYNIRSSALEESVRTQIVDALKTRFNSEVTVLRFENVGPTIGREVAQRAAMAVGVAALIVTIYMTIAFRGMQHAVRYGLCAILAMLHDIGIVFSLTAIGSLLWGWQIDSLFLTALLTVIGFSVQDKIVVFDRVRENSTIYRRLPFETLVNHSIVQTLGRSLNTQLMTVEFMLLSLALFGGITLREFSIILLVGLASGTYSSIFIASSALVVWEQKEWRTWFGRNKGEQPA